MVIIKLILLIILIALTGFFVAMEFSIVKARKSRIDQFVAQRAKGALTAKHVISHIDEFLSACQLGITMTALGLGWLGEPTVVSLLQPLFLKAGLNEAITHLVSFAIAFSLVTFLNVVVGELAPKSAAIQKAEQITMIFAKPLIWFYKILFPFIWLLNQSARLITGFFGLKLTSESELAYSEEELRHLLSESYQSGEINKRELQYVNNIFKFDNRLAKEIMVPRNEMICISIDDPLNDMKKFINDTHFTRYPLIKGDKDTVLGVINIKEMMFALLSGDPPDKKHLEPYIHSVIQVIETIPVYDLLIQMQKARTPMAILFDEYGGTSGLVTIEDILEEIVGEIQDEFDQDEISDIRKLKDDHYILNAKLLINEVNELLGIDLSNENVDTIGGWILSQRIDAKPGTEIRDEGYIFKVKDIENHHILLVEVKAA
ncbi:hemolysin family protein [Bacillus gobiensis]|uniref:hemolysin family protein n=1 Tax=Bacillus gobiensis TaxID=1441095 RepID=UPI003D214858